jgi:L-2-hydroxyglutarate oxidase
MDDYEIIGGGIVGLATAMAVGKSIPTQGFSSWKKGQDVAQHQTGRNSGVIHSVFITNPEV